MTSKDSRSSSEFNCLRNWNVLRLKLTSKGRHLYQKLLAYLYEEELAYPVEQDCRSNPTRTNHRKFLWNFLIISNQWSLRTPFQAPHFSTVALALCQHENRVERGRIHFVSAEHLLVVPICEWFPSNDISQLCHCCSILSLYDLWRGTRIWKRYCCNTEGILYLPGMNRGIFWIEKGWA